MRDIAPELRVEGKEMRYIAAEVRTSGRRMREIAAELRVSGKKMRDIGAELRVFGKKVREIAAELRMSWRKWRAISAPEGIQSARPPTICMPANPYPARLRKVFHNKSQMAHGAITIHTPASRSSTNWNKLQRRGVTPGPEHLGLPRPETTRSTRSRTAT